MNAIAIAVGVVIGRLACYAIERVIGILHERR